MGAWQSHYEANFSREMGCTEAEWLGWLPAAIGTHAWQRMSQSVQVAITHEGQALGTLRITWEVASPRAIALARIPRLLVAFAFEGLNAAQRYDFMRRFDLYMQRGGG